MMGSADDKCPLLSDGNDSETKVSKPLRKAQKYILCVPTINFKFFMGHLEVEPLH